MEVPSFSEPSATIDKLIWRRTLEDPSLNHYSCENITLHIRLNHIFIFISNLTENTKPALQGSNG